MSHKKHTDIYSDIRDVNAYDKESLLSSLRQDSNFMDHKGKLTEFGKEVISIYGVNNVDDLFNAMQLKGDSWEYRDDTNRSDVGAKIHMCFSRLILLLYIKGQLEKKDIARHIESNPNAGKIVDELELQLEEKVKSSNIHTSREAKIKLAKREYYKKLGL